MDQGLCKMVWLQAPSLGIHIPKKGNNLEVGPINAGKINKHIENIQGDQIVAVLSTLCWCLTLKWQLHIAT